MMVLLFHQWPARRSSNVASQHAGPVAGARAATADLELEDYEALFARRTIFTGTRTSDPAAAPQPLYQRILGDAWQALPAPLRAMHQCASRQVAAGEADVVRGRKVRWRAWSRS
jgi:hypothetical protein